MNIVTPISATQKVALKKAVISGPLDAAVSYAAVNCLIDFKNKPSACSPEIRSKDRNDRPVLRS